MVVLIVDGSAPVRARLREILIERLGIDPREAEDAHTAMSIASESALDLVILDIQLPASHGLELLSSISTTRPLVVLVLTNDPSEAHRRECASRGADLFFDKSREFERAIDEALALARVRAASRGRVGV